MVIWFRLGCRPGSKTVLSGHTSNQSSPAVSLTDYQHIPANWHAGPLPELAVFHLQDVCVRVQRGMRNHLKTAALDKAPQIEAVFRWLGKRGIAVVLLSDYDGENTNVLLERLNWVVGPDALVQNVVTKQRLRVNSIERACEAAGVSSAATITINDTPHLLRAATDAGVGYNIGVTSGSHSYQSLSQTAHTALLDNPVQLVNYLVDQLPHLSNAPISYRHGTATS